MKRVIWNWRKKIATSIYAIGYNLPIPSQLYYLATGQCQPFLEHIIYINFNQRDAWEIVLNSRQFPFVMLKNIMTIELQKKSACSVPSNLFNNSSIFSWEFMSDILLLLFTTVLGPWHQVLVMF